MTYEQEENESEEETTSEEVQGSTEKLSIEEVAAQVRAGHWGKGQERRQRLSEAGYNVNAVEREAIRQRNHPSEQ